MPFRNFSGSFKDVNSERYILLQTYTIENNSPNNITGLEFYQMLHGHPGSPGIVSLPSRGMYGTANFYDPLADYIPCDPNHKTGNNFRYDITTYKHLSYAIFI